MLAIIYLGVAICVGDRLCCQFYRYVSIAHRWATAVLVGLLLSSCFTYLAGRHFASASNPLLWGDLLFFAAAAIFLLTCPPKRDGLFLTPPGPRSASWDWITLGIYCALATWMMFATLDFKNGNVLIGTNQWSDYGPNTAIVQSFAFGHNFPAEYPHFANEPIRYHFLFYFLAGNLQFLGLNLAWSLNIISILTMVCMLAVVIALGELLFKSRAVGILASVFFFFHGTLSLIPFLRSQTSFKGALLSAYKLISYLSSGYPYRGEDWGIWTQVVFVNQRHFASSIGIFLVVLFFLFDRYLERAKQRKLDRALAAGVGPLPGEATLGPPMSGETAWHERGEQARDVGLVDEARTATDFQPSEQGPSTPSFKSSGEAEAASGLESIDKGAPAASSAQASEAEGLPSSLGDEPPRRASEISSISEAEPSETIKSHDESSQTANYAAGETRPSDVLPDDQGSSPGPEISSGSAPRPYDPEEAREKPSIAASQPAETEPSTFGTRAYDEYMGLEPGPGSASEAQEFEARENVIPTSQGPDRSPIPEAAGVTVPLVTVPEPVPRASRGVILDFVYDNLVNGKGFLFSGLLLGALPYWNAPVFTAAAAVLAFLFVLFPCRRYMVGLAITAAVVGLPQVLALRSGNTRAGTHLIHWGYTLGAVPVSQVLKYLWWTFGIKWVLILIGLLFASWHNLRLFVAIFSLFLLTFCLQFSDEALANHKFLNIWLVVANLFVAYGLWRLWHLRIMGWAIPFRLVALLLASPIIAGGIIDFFPIHNANFIVTGYTKDRLIDWIRAETKRDAVFLSDKFVNHPILLAGRRIFYGYTYFTWGAGYDLPKREAQYVKMFESKNAHQVFALLKANNIDYVAVDAGIRGGFKNSNEQQVYAPNFKKVFEGGAAYWNLTIYQVPENADFVPATVDPGAAAAAATTGVGVFEGGKGKENGQFDFPRGVAVDSAGNIFVADTNNGRLQKFSPTGVFLKVIGKMGDGPGEFREPSGIAIDAANNIYVADVANHRVQKLKPDGTFLAQWKGPEPGLYGPRDIAVGPDNSVYVSDQGHSRIIKLDPNGKALAVWGTPGSGDGQFTDATSVAVDGKNNKVYVADPRNKRIQVFDTNGKYLTKWAVEEWIPSGWYFQDLVVDPVAERLYASAVATDEVLVFDFTGKKIASLKPNSPDRLEGASSLALVKGKLYVVNTYASHLSWIALPEK